MIEYYSGVLKISSQSGKILSRIDNKRRNWVWLQWNIWKW